MPWGELQRDQGKRTPAPVARGVGIQRVKFRMQEWGGAVLGEKLPLDEGQEQVPARGGGRRVGVKWGAGLSGAGHCAQGPGIIGRRAPPGDDIGQRVEGKIHG